VPFNKRAWHAGLSEFKGEKNCNDFSIGIELEGADHIAYEAVQYETLASVSNVLMQTYPEIVQERLVGHSDIAPGRKTDPGESFDWARFKKCLLAAN
jgi:AmpD protein